MELWYHSSMKMRFNINKKYWTPDDVMLIKKAIKYGVYRYSLYGLDLTIKLGKPNNKNWGFSDFDTVTGFKIWLYPSDIQGMLLTVFHEMTHVKQFYSGELDLNRGTPRWKGKKCKEEYINQPWEQEAHEMEEVLLKEFLDIQL